MEGKRWYVLLKTVHKDGNGASPRHWGTSATLGPTGAAKGALTRTRYRTVWRQLPHRESAGKSLED